MEHTAPIPLRPHHGMCLAFFVGEGYSEGFAAHMGRVKQRLTDETPVRLTVGTDAICAACPNNSGGVCDKPALVAEYDNRVLRLCGLTDGQALPYGTFRDLVHAHILTAGKRRTICGGCQWDALCGK